MRITLELPDPLFARLKLQTASKRSAQSLPRLEGAIATKTAELSNAHLFELLEK
jgi:hypothetical protein